MMKITKPLTLETIKQYDEIVVRYKDEYDDYTDNEQGDEGILYIDWIYHPQETKDNVDAGWTWISNYALKNHIRGDSTGYMDSDIDETQTETLGEMLHDVNRGIETKGHNVFGNKLDSLKAHRVRTPRKPVRKVSRKTSRKSGIASLQNAYKRML